MARAAVVYLREWKATGSAHARRQAYQQLRGLAYFQTLTGDHAGEFLLWMQPDGTLNPTPKPADNPNPADAGESYWTARALWAYGEGYAAFRRHDPAFAAFLARRMDLAVKAIERDTLTRYGDYHDLHGVQVPAWLITQGADATSEALLGLAPYVRATGSRAATRVCRRLARGIAEFHAGSTTQWPFRALLPWAGSLDDWHAWGAEMAQGLAAASRALHDPALLRAAVGDAAGFTAQLLTPPVPTTAGCRCRWRRCRSPTVRTPACGPATTSGWPPDDPASVGWPASRRAGSSEPTPRECPSTTRLPVSPSTAWNPTAG